jgi:ATP-dependent exoDNAse (exonuclease V) beta subunit
MTEGLGDEVARAMIRSDLDATLLVEAAAGTGKTTELVHRIVAVLRGGRTKIDHIAAVTFTHKAAGELKVRLRQALDEARREASSQEREHLEDALKRLEEAAIGTIHSFCAQILRERPVEARIDPGFQDLPEQEQKRLYERAFHGWFERALEDSRPGLRRALSRLAWNSDSSPIDELQIAGWKLMEWRDYRARWARRPFDREQQIDALCRGVADLANVSAQCRNKKDYLYLALAPARDLATWMERANVRPTQDYDTLEGQLVKLLRSLKKNDRKGSGKFADNVSREDVLLQRDNLIQHLTEFVTSADADLAALLQSEMQDLMDAYHALKEKLGRLDFVDLLIKVRDLLRDNKEVRGFLQQRFTHIFVDEFQDTDPLQMEILLLLSAVDAAVNDPRQVVPKPGKLFVVGDPKQSIYKFRRADVSLYQEVRDQLVARGAHLVHLSTSFRALRPIQQCVNAAFAPVMQDDAASAQVGYVPVEGGRPAIDGQPSVVVVPAPTPYGKQDVSKTAINRCLPDAVVAFIEWLIQQSGWKIRDPEDPEQLIGIQARHIAVLFRRFANYGEDVSRGYVRALESRDIPHLLVGSRSFHQREEVETLRAACTAIEWPDDELAVYATLRGSFFAIADTLLLRYRYEIGRLHPIRPPATELAADLTPIGEALATLANLHRNRNRRPFAETLNHLLEATRSHVGFVLRPGGHQVLANVYRVVELARGYEQTGAISFRGLVDELKARAGRLDSGESAVFEESADGIRLLTVHSAKGLEFPVVILGDMTANIAARDPDRYIDPKQRLCATRLLWCAPWELMDHGAEERARERSEGVRVSYVAATRARDLLVIPAVGDKETEGWLEPLNKAIYPRATEYRNACAGPGCPNFGETTILERPFSLSQPEPSVKPGLHSPQQGDHHVVWWDPTKLRLRIDAKLGLRTFELLQGDPGPSDRSYQQWRDRRKRSIEAGSRPTYQISNPSEIAEEPDAGIPLEVISGSAVSGRPSGQRFGALVHAVLRDAGFDATAVQRLAQLHGRILGAPADETAAASDAVLAALRSPLLERARTAGRCQRELPFRVRLEGSRLVEGVIDLLFLEGDTWHILDFKTDVALAPRPAQYERQLRWYATAVSKLSGQPAVCHLLFV